MAKTNLVVFVAAVSVLVFCVLVSIGIFAGDFGGNLLLLLFLAVAVASVFPFSHSFRFTFLCITGGQIHSSAVDRVSDHNLANLINCQAAAEEAEAEALEPLAPSLYLFLLHHHWQ